MKGKGKSRLQNLLELVGKEEKQLKIMEKDTNAMRKMIKYHHGLISKVR